MSQRQIPERDWEALKPIKEQALARYCHRVLGEVRQLLDDGGAGTECDCFVAVHDAVRGHGRKLERMFDGFRRSTAFRQLATWAAEGLVTDAELETLGDETREIVHSLLELGDGDHRSPSPCAG